MAGFGSTVDSLLKTYSKCLSLLKGLKSDNRNSEPRQLRKCIRSDRSKVRSVYSSKLSLNGKGDAAARSSLRKVIKRLTSAMTRLMRVIARTQNPVIDYRSLTSLSNSSRKDAVKTMNELSRRLSSSSLESTSGSSTQSKREKGTKSSGKISKSKQEKPARSTRDKSERVVKEKEDCLQPALPPGPSVIPGMDPKKRISMATMSSGSTKLGEIGLNKLHRRQSDHSAASEEMAVQPIYPLRPYLHKAKKKKFLGIFGRG